jgi:glycosyltransferase involved in cell wall biosynthesis
LRRKGSALRPVHLVGIDDVQLARLYHDALCLCVPSLYEGFCLPILEAQICGCPVVCSDRSATPEIAGRGALLFDPTDATAIGDCLRKVIVEPETSRDLVRLGYQNAARFSWEAATRQYQAIFERLLKPASH